MNTTITSYIWWNRTSHSPYIDAGGCQVNLLYLSRGPERLSSGLGIYSKSSLIKPVSEWGRGDDQYYIIWIKASTDRAFPLVSGVFTQQYLKTSGDNKTDSNAYNLLFVLSLEKAGLFWPLYKAIDACMSASLSSCFLLQNRTLNRVIAKWDDVYEHEGLTFPLYFVPDHVVFR